MYKSLALAALLLPFFGHGTNEVRIKELKEARYKKLIEIVALKDVLLKCENLSNVSDDFKKLYQEALTHSINEKQKLLASKNANNSNVPDRGSIQEGLLNSNALIAEDLLNAFFGNKTFNHSVIHELFGIENDKGVIKEAIFLDDVGFFHRDKFMTLNTVFEQILAGISIIKYDQCIKELLAINNEIYNLEN